MNQYLSYGFSAFVIMVAAIAAYLKVIPGDTLVALLYGSGIGVGAVVGHGLATGTQQKGNNTP